MSEEQRATACLIVSAHSLPEKILANGDPYADQLNETADLIATAAGVKNYEVGWQSAGQTPEPWLGPDVQDLTRDLHTTKKAIRHSSTRQLASFPIILKCYMTMIMSVKLSVMISGLLIIVRLCRMSIHYLSMQWLMLYLIR